MSSIVIPPMKAVATEEQKKILEKLKNEQTKKMIAEARRKKDLINQMTNWQRNRFMRACKGNIRAVPVDLVEQYTNLPHWKQEEKALRAQIAADPVERADIHGG